MPKEMKKTGERIDISKECFGKNISPIITGALWRNEEEDEEKKKKRFKGKKQFFPDPFPAPNHHLKRTFECENSRQGRLMYDFNK